MNDPTSNDRTDGETPPAAEPPALSAQGLEWKPLPLASQDSEFIGRSDLKALVVDEVKRALEEERAKDAARFDACINDPEFGNRLVEAIRRARALGLRP